MRPLTYVLGAIAGFFTIGGIGLIIRGYQVEGGITLVVGILSLIQFIKYFRYDHMIDQL